MLQQINFYPLLPKAPKYQLTPPLIMRLLAGFAALLMVIYFINLLIYFWQNSKLADLQQTQQLAQQQLVKIDEQYNDNSRPKPLSWQNQQLAAELSAKQAALQQFKQAGSLNEQGYSTYLRGLAETIAPGVWLTNIHIISTGQQIDLTGSATDNTAIMQFIQNMSNNAVFNNKKFNVLRLENSFQDTELVNFNLSTNAGTQQGNTNGKAP